MQQKVHVVLIKCWKFLLGMPFYWGVYGHMDWWRMPLEEKRRRKRHKKNILMHCHFKVYELLYQIDYVFQNKKT